MGEYQLEKSNQLAKELESLRYELEPLEEVGSISLKLFHFKIKPKSKLFCRKNWNLAKKLLVGPTL